MVIVGSKLINNDLIEADLANQYFEGDQGWFIRGDDTTDVHLSAEINGINMLIILRVQ